jgi:hypothetical protein
MDDIKTRLGDMPVTANAKMLVSMPRPDDFVQLAERGLFAVDWSDVHRPKADRIHSYELVAIPSRPIQVGQLTSEVRPLLEGIVLPATFAALTRLDVHRYVLCRERE